MSMLADSAGLWSGSHTQCQPTHNYFGYEHLVSLTCKCGDFCHPEKTSASLKWTAHPEPACENEVRRYTGHPLCIGIYPISAWWYKARGWYQHFFKELVLVQFPNYHLVAKIRAHCVQNGVIKQVIIHCARVIKTKVIYTYQLHLTVRAVSYQ